MRKLEFKETKNKSSSTNYGWACFIYLQSLAAVGLGLKQLGRHIILKLLLEELGVIMESQILHRYRHKT